MRDGTCARLNCPNTAIHYGLCRKHRGITTHGYVDEEPVRQRLMELVDAGCSWAELSVTTGKSVHTLYRIRDRRRDQVQARTAEAIFKVPFPVGFSGAGVVDATGTHRRIRALCALGYSQRYQDSRLSANSRTVSQHLCQTMVTSATARRIAELYDELSGTEGPSRAAREDAKRKGWAPPLAWGDIDDPEDRPDLGDTRRAPFPERYAELREMETNDERIAQRMGITMESLQRQLFRYGIYERRSA